MLGNNLISVIRVFFSKNTFFYKEKKLNFV